jgi:hypothetical protein
LIQKYSSGGDGLAAFGPHPPLERLIERSIRTQQPSGISNQAKPQ